MIKDTGEDFTDTEHLEVKARTSVVMVSDKLVSITLWSLLEKG